MFLMHAKYSRGITALYSMFVNKVILLMVLLCCLVQKVDGEVSHQFVLVNC